MPLTKVALLATSACTFGVMNWCAVHNQWMSSAVAPVEACHSFWARFFFAQGGVPPGNAKITASMLFATVALAGANALEHGRQSALAGATLGFSLAGVVWAVAVNAPRQMGTTAGGDGHAEARAIHRNYLVEAALFGCVMASAAADVAQWRPPKP